MCGWISQYNKKDHYNQPGPTNMWQVLVKNARLEGFTVAHYAEKWPIATQHLAEWVKSGQLKFSEEVVEGLDNTIDTLRRLFTGGNSGRLIMKYADEYDPD